MDVIGDIALTWSNKTSEADISVEGTDLAVDQGMVTALILSLFTDRRADDDDDPPSGDPNDRRGWWADEFAEVEGDRYGSRLWLLERAKRNDETVLRAKEYVREALAWMLEDQVVASIDVESDDQPRALLLAVILKRPGRDAVTLRFSHVWKES